VLAAAAAVASFSATASQRAPANPLGTISFPTSGNPKAHPHFVRGVLWLHSFAYEEAIDAFRAAQKVDPQFAMAYWGEAMCFNQPLWFHEDAAAGRAALAKLAATPETRAAKAKTPREQAYLGAIEALYGTGDKATRDRRYADAMAALVRTFPHDEEAKAFHALALLAIMPRGDQALRLRQEAGAIAEGIFARNPRHPGAAHYILHAYDHPALASKALAAARAYAAIAPAASHALHMPAHAFVQLGLWDEAARTDEASWNASVDWASRKGLSVAMRDYHSLTWLHYEWTQQGRFTKAAGVLRYVDEAMKVARENETPGGHHYSDSEIGRGSGPLALRNDRGSMRARYVIESERWSEMKGQQSFDNVDELFALGMSAVKLGDLARASAAIDLFRKASAPGQDPGLREQAGVMTEELAALLAFAQGRQADALAAIDRAGGLQGRMPKPIGRPYPVKGADELYGEMLLAAGRPADAIVWFERALERTANRSRAVLGLARAAAKAGQTAKSRGAYEQFLSNWRLADRGLPEVDEARAFLATVQHGSARATDVHTSSLHLVDVDAARVEVDVEPARADARVGRFEHDVAHARPRRPPSVFPERPAPVGTLRWTNLERRERFVR
jgi:tetratricopeptide (TPR) repeat protein